MKIQKQGCDRTKKEQEDLIRYLYEHEERLTSETLSRALLLSIRTIKSYIVGLNLSYPDPILSSNRRCAIHKQKASVLLRYRNDIPQSYGGRCVYLIKKLLFEKRRQLDIFDLCDELFINYSTLKNDIYKMNTNFAHFQITFSCIDNKIDIRGTEKNKKRLIAHVMSEGASGNFLDLSFLRKGFPTYDIGEACTLIKQVLHKYRYYINDFSFINLILHVAIMINRMHSGGHIPDSRECHPIDGLKEKPIIDELCMTLEQIFDVTLTNSEKFEIYILFKTNANYHVQDQIGELSKVVSEDILSLSHQLIQSIDRYFLMSLIPDGFLTPFTLHLKNLKNRFEQHSVMKNPILESIKISCPMICDIATLVAYQLIQTFQQEISEDEIAFLALHVGTEIERQKKAETRVSCMILCPEYPSVRKLLYSRMLMNSDKRINIQKLVSFGRATERKVFDLLITTIPLPESPEYLTVLFPPLPMSYDKDKIVKATTRIKNTKRSRILTDNIDFYFSEDLFYFKEESTGKGEAINELADRMISLGYVRADFKDEVWKRERAGSAAFTNIAAPHPMEMSAYKANVVVIAYPKGMEWANQHIVNVVLMIAFNKTDNKHFHDLYESLILLFSEQEVTAKTKECRNFEDFKQIVMKDYIKYN